MMLPLWPAPLSEEEQKIIFENQTAILEWLLERGHEIDDEETLSRREHRQMRKHSEII